MVSRSKITDGIVVAATTLFGIAALSACSNYLEEAVAGYGETGTPVEVSVSETRLAGTEWEEDDAVGLYVYKTGTTDLAEEAYSNVKYLYNGDNMFTADATVLYYPTDGSAVDIIAYYPYSSDDVSDGKYTIDVSDQTSVPDLLWDSVCGKSETDASVIVTFRHKMSMLTFRLTESGDLTSDGESFSVKLNSLPQKGTFDLSKGEWEASDEVTTTEVVTLNVDTLTSQSLVLPGTTADVLVEIADTATNGQVWTFSFDLSEGGIDSLVEGYNYIYNVDVAAKSLTSVEMSLIEQSYVSNNAASVADLSFILASADNAYAKVSTSVGDVDTLETWLNSISLSEGDTIHIYSLEDISDLDNCLYWWDKIRDRFEENEYKDIVIDATGVKMKEAYSQRAANDALTELDTCKVLKGIKTLLLPSTLTGGVGKTFFSHVPEINSINIPNCCTEGNNISIGDFAFYANGGLDTVSINIEKVDSVGQYAFCNDSNLLFKFNGKLGMHTVTDSIYQADNITEMGYLDLSGVSYVGAYAFKRLINIDSIFFGSSLSEIGAYAFSYIPLRAMDLSSIDVNSKSDIPEITRSSFRCCIGASVYFDDILSDTVYSKVAGSTTYYNTAGTEIYTYTRKTPHTYTENDSIRVWVKKGTLEYWTESDWSSTPCVYEHSNYSISDTRQNFFKFIEKQE